MTSINNPHILEKEQDEQTKHQNISEKTLPPDTELGENTTVYRMINRFSDKILDRCTTSIWDSLFSK